jgi:hypothetical protein
LTAVVHETTPGVVVDDGGWGAVDEDDAGGDAGVVDGDGVAAGGGPDGAGVAGAAVLVVGADERTVAADGTVVVGNLNEVVGGELSGAARAGVTRVSGCVDVQSAFPAPIPSTEPIAITKTTTASSTIIVDHRGLTSHRPAPSPSAHRRRRAPRGRRSGRRVPGGASTFPRR